MNRVSISAVGLLGFIKARRVDMGQKIRIEEVTDGQRKGRIHDNVELKEMSRIVNSLKD